MLWLLKAWSSAKQNKGGLSKAADKHKAADLLKALFTHGIQKNLELDIELVDEWEVTWPRPGARADVERVKLLVRRGGYLDFRAWHDSCYQDRAPNGVLGPARMRMWHCHIHPFLDMQTKCLHLSDIPTVKCRLDCNLSLWRQVLYQVAKHIEAHGSCK